MKKNIIYLTGFMGAGKSTVGPILANTLGWDFLDLDRVIEQHAGKKIREIFEESGEQHFRELETRLLKDISDGDNLIISLGGGTIASGDNLSILKKNGEVIYLKTSLEAVYKRLMYKQDRPIFRLNELQETPKEEILNKIKSIYDAREPFYEKADFIVDTENVSIGRTVDFIASLVNRQRQKN
jgi:shikimate kinase